MNNVRLSLFRLSACLAFALGQEVAAETFLSNLETRFVGGIGDIHGLFPGGNPYGSNTALFRTGSGGGFSVDSITLEFTKVPNQWESVRIVLQEGTGGEIVGIFGSPLASAKITQWPMDTIYIDYSPVSSVRLNPFSDYALTLSVPEVGPGPAELLFAWSGKYTTAAGWTMSPTITGNPFAQGQYLKFAVNATAVPEPSPLALLQIGAVIACVSSIRSFWRRAVPLVT